MGKLVEHGFSPIYDAFQYNNDSAVGRLLYSITKTKSQGNRLGLQYQEFTGENLRIKQQFILRLSRILSGAFENEEIHLAWLAIHNEMSVADLKHALIRYTTDIWLTNEGQDQPTFLSKLLSITIDEDENIDQFLKNQFLPILSRINNLCTIIFVFDLQNSLDKKLLNIIKEFKAKLAPLVKERSILIFVLTNDSYSSDEVYIHSPEKYEDYSDLSIKWQGVGKISKKDIEQVINDNISWLKPLSVLTHPADANMIEFIGSYFESLDEQLKILGKNNVINFLNDSGISLNNEFRNILQKISEQKIIEDEHLIVLGLSGTGLDNKSQLASLISRFGSSKSQWKELSSYFQSHGSVALGCSIIGNEKLCDWHIESILEAVPEMGFLKSPFQIRSMMDYTGQILLAVQKTITEKNQKHFIKLLERVADRYSSYLRNQNSLSPEVMLEASRYQYKVGHLYDRLFNKFRLFVQHPERNTSYESAAAVLELPSIENPLYDSIAYRKGTSLSKINKIKAYEHYILCANAMFDYEILYSNIEIEPRPYRKLSAEEMAVYAIKSGVEKDVTALDNKIGRIINKLLERTGANIDSKTYYEAVIYCNPSKFQSVYLLPQNSKFKITIYCNKGDLHVALSISENIFSKLLISTEVQLISAQLNIDFKPNPLDEFQIIIGAPDTADGVGHIVVQYDQLLEQTYHLRMHTDFGEPVLLEKEKPPTLILCGSGINGNTKAWALGYENFIKLLKEKYNPMETFIIGTLLTSLLKRIGDKTVDLLFDKVLKKKTHLEHSSAQTLVEKINSGSDPITKNELLQILESLGPSERNIIVSSIQKEKESTVIIINSIIEKLDLSLGAEELEFYSKTLWGFANDVANEHLNTNQSSELNSFISGFNLRYDRIRKIITNYRTQGELNENNLVIERTALYHQAKNFKRFIELYFSTK